MGKSRRSRGKGGPRADPLAKPVKPPSDPELAALREKTVLPVLKDLQSALPKSRTAAAGAIANIIQDSKCRKLLLREQVVHIVLTQTLTDTSLESRAAGWEILKVLTREEEADFCVHLYRVDVLTAVEHAARKVTETITGPNPVQISQVTKAEQRYVWLIAEALAEIISALGEAHDEILGAVVKKGPIVQFLFVLATSPLATPEVVNTALSCLMTLSEDNRQFVEAMLGDTQTGCFKHLMASRTTSGLRGVLACGVLHNIFSTMEWYDSNPGREDASDAVLVPALAHTLEATKLESKSAKGDGGSSPVEVLQTALEVLASIGTDLQPAFEKSNKKGGERRGRDEQEDVDMDGDAPEKGVKGEDDELKIKDEEDEMVPDEEVDIEDEEDEMDSDEMEADMERVTGADDDGDEVSGLEDLPTLKILLQEAIPQVIKIAKAGKAEDEASSLIQGHALAVLNNVAWAIACLDFSGDHNTAILDAWVAPAQTIWKEAVAPVLSSDTSDVELATQVTGIAWAIAQTLRDRTPLNGDEHAKFMSLYHASKGLPVGEDPFQSLGVKCIGVLGALAHPPAPVELNREIGVFLLTIVAALPESRAADVVEALNQLFEIYGDETASCDREVFWKDGFLRHFEEATAKVRTMVKQVDKKKEEELRARAEEAALNLRRFIEYKKKNQPHA